MIALRARRESMHIAQDVAFPHIPQPPTYTLPVREGMPQWWYDQNLWGTRLSQTPDAAPRWWKVFLVGYVLVIFVTVSAVIEYVLLR